MVLRSHGGGLLDSLTSATFFDHRASNLWSMSIKIHAYSIPEVCYFSKTLWTKGSRTFGIFTFLFAKRCPGAIHFAGGKNSAKRGQPNLTTCGGFVIRLWRRFLDFLVAFWGYLLIVFSVWELPNFISEFPFLTFDKTSRPCWSWAIKNKFIDEL